MKNPTEPFVKHFINKAYSGRATEKIVQQFTDLLKKSVNQVVNDLINERLKSALTKDSEPIVIAKDESNIQNDTKPLDDKKLETTVEEMEAFFIVKSILRENINSSRISHRDAQSYFAIMLDDNNRKIICRLYFNSSKKQIGLMTADKTEVKKELQSLDEIYNFKKELFDALKIYEGSTNKE
jgi:hypothetical protein